MKLKNYMIAAVVAAIFAGTAMAAPADLAPRAASWQWAGLTQSEVDDLKMALKKLGSHDVQIYCIAEAVCGAIAQDFVDAFETAGWRSRVDHPFADRNIGINVGPDNEDGRALAAAIEQSVHGRFKVGIIAASINPGRLALVLSAKHR